MDQKLYEWLLMVEDYILKSKTQPTNINEPVIKPNGIIKKDGKYFEGIGEFYVSNNFYFRGEMKNYKFWNGTGREVYKKSGDIYEGTWVNGKFHNGYRIMNFPNGDFYEGSFRNGKRYNGQGKTTLPTGIFVGLWSEGCFSDGEINMWYSDKNNLKGRIKNKFFYEGECVFTDQQNQYNGSYKSGLRWNGIFIINQTSYVISDYEIYLDEEVVDKKIYDTISNYKFRYETFKKILF